jgi:hypothetical protein
LEVKPDINISVEYECAFHDACYFEYLIKVAKLLLQYKTQNYFIFKKNKIKIEKIKIYGKNQKIAKQI